MMNELEKNRIKNIWDNLCKIKKDYRWRYKKLSEIENITIDESKRLIKDIKAKDVKIKPIIKKIYTTKQINKIKKIYVDRIIYKENDIKPKKQWKYPTDEEIIKKGQIHYLFGKLKTFYGNHKEAKKNLQKVLDMIGETPICYLTGDKLDLSNPKNYSIDHIIPKSQGGKNEIENMGFSTRWANICKSGLNPEEFLKLCKKVVKHYKKV